MNDENGRKKERRKFTDEFKAGAVRLVLDEGRSATSVARDLGVNENNLHKWVRQARIDRGQGRAGELTTDERERLKALEKENRVLRTERELLKKWAAFFAKETSN